MFWSRWIREYLPELQNRREPYGRGEQLKVGDVVLIADGNLARNTWPRGLVTTTYPGADGVVRAADVYTRGGVLRRPTKKLVILPENPAFPAQSDASPKANRRCTAGEMYGTTNGDGGLHSGTAGPTLSDPRALRSGAKTSVSSASP